MRNFFCTAILLGSVCTAAIAGPKEDAMLVVERWTQAFTASDVDAIVGLYATDAVFMGTGTKTIVPPCPRDMRVKPHASGKSGYCFQPPRHMS